MTRPLNEAWDALGERAPDVVRKTIAVFYDCLMEDPCIAPYFVGVNIKVLKQHQYNVLAYLTGGPSPLAGKTVDEVAQLLREKHAGVRHGGTGRLIDNPVYFKTGFHLTYAMTVAEIPREFSVQLVDVWLSLGPVIVRDTSKP